MNFRKEFLFSFIGLMIFCAGIPVLSQDNIQSGDEFETLMQKIRQDFVSNNPSIDGALAKYNEQDGSFNDVDYASEQMTNWPPLIHVERISDFVFAYTNPKNKYFGDEALYHKIVKGLEFWQERNPWCRNWWYNQISEPQKLGVLLIQMRTGKQKLPDELENNILDRIREDGGDPAKWTGANRTDIALHWIYRSCLQRNAKDLAYALENVYNPVVYTTGEGFQYDNSNFQHGQQLYIGGYGDEILKGVTQVAMYTRGTRFAMPQDKLNLISKFMRETYYAVMRGKYMSFDVLGRSISRPGILDKSRTALFAKRMVELDPVYADEFRDIVARMEGTKAPGEGLVPKHTHYFRGDYTLHVRPQYAFDVRLVSARTARCEYGNGENLKAYFLSDGCTNITTRGGEYFNIFPTWNWTRVPGVTAPQLKEIPLAASDWQCMGTSNFAGGVSDSLYGVTAYAYMDTYKNINTGAHKAWFFFDDEVVCLGSDIRSFSSEAVYTSVNQCLASTKGAVISVGGKQEMLPSHETVYEKADWVLHDGIGYLFPQGGRVVAGVQRQSGSWYDINNSVNRKEPVEENVFTLSLDHGQQPQAATYAYVVVPGKRTAEEMEAYRKAASVEILSNTANVQAVHHKKLGIWQLVFYQPGEFTDGRLSVCVDKPCTLILKDADTRHPILHVADPGQTLQPIRVTVQVKGRKGGVQTVEFRPSDNPVYAGATQAFVLDF